MLPRGEWRRDTDGDGRSIGFHLNSLYSPVGWLTWPELVRDYLQAQSAPARMQVFVNTKLAQTWRDNGEAPAWEPLYERRGGYGVGEVPDGVHVLTAGADCQADRIEVEVVGWGPDPVGMGGSVGRSVIWQTQSPAPHKTKAN